MHSAKSRLARRPAGVPPNDINLHRYHPSDPRQMAAIRLNYPRISAVAGPCGLWPEDLGPSIKNKSYIENKEYYNFGCAYQRNMAAMVDNPVGPGAAATRDAGLYARGAPKPSRNIARAPSTSTTYPEADKAKLSDTGK